MSLGRPESKPDVYPWTTRFLYMDPGNLLRNNDSYGNFAGAIAEGVPTSLLLTGSAGYGYATPSTGPAPGGSSSAEGSSCSDRCSGCSIRLGIGATLISSGALCSG
jgi:hypothetical protein